jgi:hypothetical protein
MLVAVTWMDDEFRDALEATVIDDALVELGERRKNFRAMPRTAICSRRRSASTERCLSAGGDLLRLQILLVRGQGPGMPKWISKDTVSIAPEHIFQRHAHLRAGGHRSFEGGVHVLDIHVNGDGGSTDALGSPALHLRKLIDEKEPLIDEKEPGVPDFELSMHESFAIRSRQAPDFLSPKGLLVEFDGLTGPFDDQVRSQRVVAIRNRLDAICASFGFYCLRTHVCLSLWPISRSTGFSIRGRANAPPPNLPTPRT